MSQYDFGTIVPTTKSGTALAADLNSWRTALHSAHKGATQPTYRVAGMMWLDDTATPWILKIYDGTDWITMGVVNATGNVFGTRFNIGASIAAAAALPLVSDGNSFVVTGNTNITSMAATTIGNIVTLTFTGTPALVHHATDLILPNGENIQVVAGDVGIFIEYAAGDWRLLSWQPSSIGGQITKGTTTPTVVGSTVGGAGTYTQQSINWYRFGKLIFFSGVVAWTAHTGTGTLTIATGLPAASGDYPINVVALALTFTGVPVAQLSSGTSVIVMMQEATGSTTNMAMDTGATINLSGFYLTT